jgi:hypothetical protein
MLAWRSTKDSPQGDGSSPLNSNWTPGSLSQSFTNMQRPILDRLGTGELEAPSSEKQGRNSFIMESPLPSPARQPRRVVLLQNSGELDTAGDAGNPPMQKSSQQAGLVCEPLLMPCVPPTGASEGDLEPVQRRHSFSPAGLVRPPSASVSSSALLGPRLTAIGSAHHPGSAGTQHLHPTLSTGVSSAELFDRLGYHSSLSSSYLYTAYTHGTDTKQLCNATCHCK